jgi:hypothetical protein
MIGRKRTVQSVRRDEAATSRAAERRRREQDAPLLIEEVPLLRGLSIEVKETGLGPGMLDAKHIRRFEMATAPALFLVPCGDRSCEGGGHDISVAVMEALRGHQALLEGAVACCGRVGEQGCSRSLHFAMVAAFDEPRGKKPAASLRANVTPRESASTPRG